MIHQFVRAYCGPKTFWKPLNPSGGYVFLALIAGIPLITVAAHATPPPPAATTVVLTISSTTVPYKSPITLTANVTSVGTPVSAGLILFCDASAAVCENNSALGLAQLTSPGATATLKLGSGPLGSHSYKAVYRANGLYASSTSNTVSYSVQGTYSSTTSLSSTGSVGNYSLTGTVVGVGSPLTGPTGDVSFIDTSAGKHLLGTEPLGAAVLSDAFVQAPNSPFRIATSTTPQRSVAIASAYLSNDNNLDVITGDYSQTVTVLRGNGDGTFQPKVNYPGCPTGKAVKIALADFSRDGNTDIALGCSDGTNGSLTILLGNGDGSFQAPTAYTAGDVAGIAIGDFNRDGLVDFAVSNYSQQNVMLFTGKGNGTFNPGVVILSPSSRLHDVVVADFNSDGKDDLLYAVNTAASGSALSDLYLAAGNGDGTFQAPFLIASKIGEFLSSGDLNGDNFPDVVSTTITGTPPNIGPSLFVILGNGDGTFKPTVTYTSDIPSDPHVADVNGDGKPDIIAGGSYGALVYYGNGDGTFQPYSEPSIGNFALTFAVNAGDYNNDGNADLIGTDASSPRAAVSLSEVRQTAISAALAGVALYPLGSGTHNVEADYAGDTIYIASTSSTIHLLAAPTPTTLKLAVSPTSATLSGQPVTLTATLAPYAVGPPNTTTDTETVNFYNGSTLIGAGTLINGVATLTTSTLPAGTDALKAVFSGDANYLTSTSGVWNVTVTTILLSSSLNPSVVSQAVTFTATVATGSTGTVTFNDGATVLGTANISVGVATLTTSSLSVGQHDITGKYNGDISHSAALSPVLTQQVNKTTPIVNVVSSGSSTYGSTVIITTSVPPGTTGTLTVTSGGVTLGTGTVDSNGTVTITTSSLPPGSNTITASYSGDSNNNPAIGSTTQTVIKATPPVAVSTSGPSTYGSPVTITATMPAGTTGIVTITSGGVTLGSGTVSPGGTVIIVTSSLPTGSDPITASYGGDANNTASSGTATQTVSKSNPASTLTSSQSTSISGSYVTFTDTLPASVTGTVTFTSGGVTLGTSTVTNGVATLTTGSLPSGSNTVVATYNGDTNDTVSVATTVQTVNKGTPSVTVTTSGPSTYGSPVTITSSLPAGTTGTVTFTSGGTVLGTGTVGSNGTTTVTVTSLPVGSDPITASYSGDSSNNSVSGSVSQTVTKGSSSVTLTSSPNPSTSTQPVTFTAALPTGATGTVTFMDGGTILGTGTITNGVATFTTSSLTSGSHTVTASYAGDSSFTASTSAPLVQTVNKFKPVLPPPGVSSSSIDAGSQVTLSETVPSGVTGPVSFYNSTTLLGTVPIINGVATLTVSSLPIGTAPITASTPADANNNAAVSPPTSVTVTKTTPMLPPPGVSNPNPVAGSPVTITETVPAGVTGTVLFYNGGTLLGSATVSDGIASLTVTSLPAGPAALTAVTPSTSMSNAATSPVTSIVVAKAAGVVTLTSSLNPASLGQAVTFTAAVTSGATGSVTFYDGTAVLGVAPISATGIATFTTAALAIGSHPVSAAYSGDTNYTAATSTNLTEVINKIPTAITISQSSPVELLNTTVTFVATVTTTSPTPTGKVTFFDGGIAIATAPLSSNGSTSVSSLTLGSAFYATSSLTTASHQITAVYSGDTGFLPSSSQPLTNVVADFTNEAKGVTTQNMFPGGSTTYTFLLNPIGAPTFLSDTTVAIDGLPLGSSYSFSPAVIPAGSGPTTVTLSLTTSKDLRARNHLPAGPSRPDGKLPIALAVLGLAGFGAIRKHRRKIPRMLVIALLCGVTLLPVAALSGCAGGYFTLTPNTYQLNVTGTEGSIQHTATATLIVQ